MVDLLDITSNRIRIRDTDGTTVFDTEERPFLPLATLTNSITFSARSASSNTSGVVTLSDVDANYLIGSCPSECNVVRGAFYASFASTVGSAVGTIGVGWFNAGGSYIHYHDSATMVAYTFFAQAGGIWCNERALVIAQVPAAGTSNITVLSVTLQYKLIAGVYL